MKLYIKNRVNPITCKRANEFNEQFAASLVNDLNKSYEREKRLRKGIKENQIVECYKKAWLCYQLYSCLVEEDEERLRGCVQRVADENLNEIVNMLVDLGYVF